MASLAYFVLYLCLHACAARPLMDKETVKRRLQLSGKDVKSFVADERFVNHDDKASDYDSNLDNHKFSEYIEGKKLKTSYSWMNILQQATGSEVWKKAERSTLESGRSNAEEDLRSKDNKAVDDIDVMDYAQPHRKPPIHNKGT